MALLGVREHVANAGMEIFRRTGAFACRVHDVTLYDDIIAPVSVGEYMQRVMPNATLKIIENVGHCPHLSQPTECGVAIDGFLKKQGF